MEYINPLFRNTTITSSNEKKSNSIVNQKTMTTPIQKPKQIRATRKDKTHNVKFPVSPMIQMKLKSMCKQAERVSRAMGNPPLSQTKFNSVLLRYGLQHENILEWNHRYQDSKVYMHTNILESEYVEIGGPHGIAIRKNLSERKVVYQIMMSVIKWMEGEGSIEKILQ